MDNLSIKDKIPGPNMSIIWRFHCTGFHYYPTNGKFRGLEVMFESANAQQFKGLLYCLLKFTMVIFTFLETVGDRSNREDFEQFVAQNHCNHYKKESP